MGVRAGRLPPAVPHAVVVDVWQMAEWPQRCLTVAGWVDLYRTAGSSPTGRTCRLKRRCGCSVAPPGAARLGMAWTTDLERARWFANRWDGILGRAEVYTAAVEPAGVLAIIDGR